MANNSLRNSTRTKGRCLRMGDAVGAAEWDFTDVVGMAASKQLAEAAAALSLPPVCQTTTRRRAHHVRSSKEELSQSQNVILNNHSNRNKNA